MPTQGATMDEYHGADRRHPADLSLLLARLEGKVDALTDAMRAASLHVDHLMDDHEARLRGLESGYHLLATKADLEEVEDRRERQGAERHRRMVAWIAVIVAVAVPAWVWIAELITRQL